MDSKEIFVGAFKRHQETIERSLSTLAPDIDKAAALFAEAVRGNRCVFTCGNGGSAADSQHLSGEFLCRYKEDRRPLKAIALMGDVSALTAIGNDYSYDVVFARQLQTLGEPGDLLVAFTTSGTSKNILAALDSARSKKMKTLVFTGEGGVHLRDIADAVIAIPSRETARIQEVHELVYHLLCEYIDAILPDLA